MISNSTSLVSVIMPVYNAGEFLYPAVKSILHQINIKLELILVDDHSTDHAIDDLPLSITSDARLQRVSSAGDGVVAAMKTGYELSTGKYIARMDADDIAMPDRLFMQLQYLEENPQIGIAGAQVKIISEDIVGHGFLLYEKWLNRLCEPADIERELFVESPIPNPTAFFRREVYQVLGGYQDPEWAEDYDLWLRASAAGIKMGKPGGVLLYWREHANRLTHRDSRYNNKLFLKAKAFYLSQSNYLLKRKAVIWGTGPIGVYLHDVLSENKVNIEAFIDVNPKRIGGEKRGLPVYHYKEALQFSDVLIIAAVGSRGARENIRQALLDMGKREGHDFLFAA